MNNLEISQILDSNVELAKELLRIKSQKDTITLAHNYQRGEVQ